MLTLASALTPDGWTDIALRLGCALVLGAACGWDREREGRAAGLRTYMMVSMGACAFTLICLTLIDQLRVASDTIHYDPSRIIAGIVTGIGFLGAGTIIQSGGKITGLTTAAGLWAIASVGIATGAGFYVIAGLVTGGTIFVLLAVKFAEIRWLKPEDSDDAE